MGEIFKQYLACKNKAVENKNKKTVSFEYDGQAYCVIMPKRRANRMSVIRCLNGMVVWEQIPLLYLLHNERGAGEVIGSFPVAVDKKKVTLFVIKGNPGSIVGLDEGIFCSAKNFDSAYINVMSESRFKEL